MKTATLLIVLLIWPLAGWALPPLEPAALPQWHWLPQTAVEARIRTEAAAAWLQDPTADPTQWRRQVELRALTLARQTERDQPLPAVLLDGSLGWLVQARALEPLSPGVRPVLAEALVGGAAWSGAPAIAGARGMAAALDPEQVWEQLRARLLAAEIEDVDLQLAAFWAGPAALARQAEAFERSAADERARLAAMLPGADTAMRVQILASMAMAASRAGWEREDELRAVWQLFESLAWLTVADPMPDLEPQRELLAQISEVGLGRLSRVDTGLPVVVAQLEDAAAFLSEQPPARHRALEQLADAYFRLALFVPDAAFYLDQPVRERINRAIEDCHPVPDLIGPLPREVFEQCPERLFALLDTGLDSEELVGGATGPFAPEFLRREMDLVSWQRARYLDGYLDRQLQTQCEQPVWSNPLEWSIIAQVLASWVPQRPVFFSAARWQQALLSFEERIEAQKATRTAWLDCVSGHGGQRLDPVSRILVGYGRSLADFRTALENAYQVFKEEQTRPGSDIDLDGDVDQITTYRPEGLSVRPCEGGMTCAARVELPASRALLGLFPNTYLMADQLGLGRLGLCYDQVRWEDREMRPARRGDDQVANYHGRLSFELVGTFDDGSGDGNGPETVFRRRLTAPERHHYLFARAGEDVLGLDCPSDLAGQPVASQLPSDRRGLVPARLTYFASLPTSPNAQLQANWTTGAEWRDWFLTNDRVEVLESPRPALLRARVQAELEALVSRRERALTARLLATGDDDPLSATLARLGDDRDLLRRVMELHYPRLIRHDTQLRSLTTGSAGLIGRDQVRRRRDEGRLMQGLADEGLERLADFHELWRQVPVAVRELGQPSPEAEHARRLLLALGRITRPESAAAEVSPEP